MLREAISEELEWVISRLAEYDPIRALQIKSFCTLQEIAEAATIKMHDNSIKVRPPKVDV